MEQELQTAFDDACAILSEIWLERDSINYRDFFEFNLLGVTLAYSYNEELIDDLSPDAVDLIEESFDAFLDEHEIDDLGFSSLQDILKAAKDNE